MSFQYPGQGYFQMVLDL